MGKDMSPCVCVRQRQVPENYITDMNSKICMCAGIIEPNGLDLDHASETFGQFSTLVCIDATSEIVCCVRCHHDMHENCASSHEHSSFTCGFLACEMCFDRHTSPETALPRPDCCLGRECQGAPGKLGHPPPPPLLLETANYHLSMTTQVPMTPPSWRHLNKQQGSAANPSER
ncbi:hypothetical protein PR048_006668 [Dryococelus australis]|uniref:Uncharacterized protein n=1 Tax=Dryococelus australis TaxID=614101 RepID=A0ABQ9IBN1_9NEOP|nr:hypothetical protein PR048_006668 [Dryococelus australis]